MTNTPNKQCILATRENHASGSRMNVGSHGRCNDVGLKTETSQAKMHTHASHDNDWRLAA